MSYTKQVISGSTYYFIGVVLAAVLAYLTKFVLVRNLSVEEYGLFFAILTFILIFGIFRTLGLNEGLVRFIAEYNTKKKFGEIKSLITGAFLVQLAVSLVIVVLLWFSANYLAVNYFGDIRAKSILRLLSFYLPLSVIVIHSKSIFQSFKKSKYLSAVQFVQNALVFIGVVIGLHFGLGIYAPVWSYIISFGVFLLIFIIPLLKSFNYFKFKQKNLLSVNKELIIFSFPLLITGAGSLVITYFDTLMLTLFDSLKNVGIYNIIYPTAILVTMIGISIGVILYPILTELWARDKKNEIISAYKIINKYLFILCIPLVLALMMFSKDIIRVLFGVEYLGGVVAFNILLIGVVFSVFVEMNNRLLLAMKEPKKIMYVFLLGGLLNILLNLFLIPLFSLIGASIASVLSFFFMLFMANFYTRKKIEIKIPWKEWLIILLTSLIIPLLPWLLLKTALNPYLVTFIGLIVGGFIYLWVLYTIKLIKIKEIRKILL